MAAKPRIKGAPQKRKLPEIKPNEPKRHPGVAWTGLAVVLAAGSGALNVTGWAIGIDTQSVVATAFGCTLVAVCVASEGVQLLAMHNAELAWKAKPTRQIAKFGALLGLAGMCAVWNGYSAHRAIDRMNEHAAAGVWTEYRAKPENLLARLTPQWEDAVEAQAAVRAEASPDWGLYQAQLERIRSAPPAQSTMKTQDAAAKTRAGIDAWVTSETARLRDVTNNLRGFIDRENARVEGLAEATRINPDLQIGLSAGVEIAKLVMIWAGSVVTRKRKSKKNKTPIQWGNYFKPVRSVFGVMARVIPFRKRA